MCSTHRAYDRPDKLPRCKAKPIPFFSFAQLSTCGPIAFDKSSDDRSSWVTGIIRACTSNSAIKGILVRGGVKAWVTIGTKKFMKLQMSSNPIDAKYALRTENILESEHALATATSRGISDLLKEQALVFDDWTADIEAVQTDITVIHGCKNKLYSIESVRSLAAAFSNKIDLFEIKNAGFTVAQSHPDKVIKILRSVVDAQIPVEQSSNSRAIDEAIV